MDRSLIAISRVAVTLGLAAAAIVVLPSGARADAPGVFAIDCYYSHSAPDDPIVFPGQPGASHQHDFYGNTTTDAFSTTSSLSAGSTKCKDQDDAAGYWNPAGYLGGARLLPRRIAVYYVNRMPESVETIPSGLQMVGGDSHATSPQDNPNAFWFCGSSSSPMKSHPYDCTDYDGDVTGGVRFPSCWDGDGLDRTDVRYPEAGGDCPTGFGHRMLTLSYRVHFGIKDPCLGAVPCDPTDTPDENIQLSLSSGPYYTLHSDFWNTWDQAQLDGLVANCDNAHVNCGKIVSSPTIPAAPKVTATPGDSMVTLSWPAPADGGSAITGYTVYRSERPAEETPLASIGPDTSYEDDAVAEGTTYYYRVAATSDVGEGVLSNEVSAAPLGPVPPEAPTLSARTGYKDGVRLSWAVPADGGSPITEYRISKSRTPGAERYVFSVSSVTHYLDTRTRSGVRYYYRIAAVNDAGEGPPSNAASARAR